MRKFTALAALLLSLSGCGSSSDQIAEAIAHDDLIVESTFQLDPTDTTPLAGELQVNTLAATQLVVSVDDGSESWKVTFPETALTHLVPILGFRPNTPYTVTVAVIDELGHEVALENSFSVITAPLPADFPVVEVNTSVPELMEPGFMLLDRFSRGRQAPPDLETYSAIYDADGDVVWYSSVWGGGAMLQFENGNLFYRSDDQEFVEIDLLGHLVSAVTPERDDLHHDVYPTTHGTYLSLGRERMQVDDYPTSDIDPDAPRSRETVEHSPVVEFDSDGAVINTWRPIDMLDPTRISYLSLREVRAGGAFDWGHSNAVFHDVRDDSILVSVRHQEAVIKFSRATGDLIWILGTHENWNSELQPFLLTPIGVPFEWQYFQHAPMVTESGTLMVFDNGNFRASPFDGKTPLTDAQNHSRAVEYAIDEERMEVRQVWEFGGASSPRLYAGFIGDADSLPITRNTLVTFGGVTFIDGVTTENLGLGLVVTRVIEVTHDTPATVVFDMMIYEPTPGLRVQTPRSEKLPSLYPAGVVVTPIQPL